MRAGFGPDLLVSMGAFGMAVAVAGCAESWLMSNSSRGALSVPETPPAEPTAGGAFYVSPAGSDRNSCSRASPCRQIRRALQLARSDDVINVADGSYLGFDVDDMHGTATQPIAIHALGGGANIVATADRGDNRDNIYVQNSSYITIDGLRSAHAPRSGIRVSHSQFITIKNGTFSDNARWGIFTDFSDDLLIQNNQLSGSRREHGVYVSNSGQRPVIRDNRIFGNRQCGIHINADASQGGSGITRGALIERNLIYGNGAGGGGSINLDGVHDSTIRNNVIYNNRNTGITIFKEDGATGPRGNLIAHNTVVQAPNGRMALQIAASTGENIVRNNILLHPNVAKAGIEFLYPADLTNTNSDYNILDRVSVTEHVVPLAQFQSTYRSLEKHSFSAAPAALFLDAAKNNYDMKSGSPAVDTGAPLPDVATDFLGRTRPQGLGSDIGAYEKR